MSSSVVSFLVVNAGVVDVDATVASFRTAVETYLSSQVDRSATIQSAVDAALTAAKAGGTVVGVKKPVLISMVTTSVLAAQNLGQGSFTEVANQVKTYLANQEGKLYSTRKGPSGGVFFLADVPVKSAKVATQEEVLDNAAE